MARDFGFSFAGGGGDVVAIRVDLVVSSDTDPIQRGCAETRVGISTNGSAGVLLETRVVDYSISGGWNSTVANVSYPLPGEDGSWGRADWTSDDLEDPGFGVAVEVTNSGGEDLFAFVQCLSVTATINCSDPGGCLPMPVTTGSTLPPPTRNGTDATEEGEETRSDTELSDLSPLAVALAIGVAVLVCASVSVTAAAVWMYSRTNRKRKQYKREKRDGEKNIWLSNVEVLTERKIGRGNFGDVYMGNWNQLQVACKLVRTDNGRKADAKNKLIGEITILKSLKHPNVLQFLGLFVPSSETTAKSGTAEEYEGEEEGEWQGKGMEGGGSLTQGEEWTRIYIITEYMEGGNLEDVLKWSKTVRDSDLLKIISDVIKGMIYLHDEWNITHRDLASRNILLNNNEPSNWTAKIADFGLSVSYRSSSSSQSLGDKGKGKSSSSTLSIQLVDGEDGESVDFPVRTTAPEVLNLLLNEGGGGGEISFDPKSDVWSFGILLWETFAKGQKPFSGIGGDDVKNLVRGCKGPPLLGPEGSPTAVKKTVADCLNPDPNKRPRFSDILTTFGGDFVTVSILSDDDDDVKRNGYGGFGNYNTK